MFFQHAFVVIILVNYLSKVLQLCAVLVTVPISNANVLVLCVPIVRHF